MDIHDSTSRKSTTGETCASSVVGVVESTAEALSIDIALLRTSLYLNHDPFRAVSSVERGSRTVRFKWLAVAVDRMYDSILLPTDGSERAAAALEHALGAVDAYGADLHVISVIDRRVVLAADVDEKDEIRSELAEEADAAVTELAEEADATGVSVTTTTPEGVPHREILSYASESEIDLLVLGTHGRTGREKRLNLGSTTERVVKAADRPVLVVDIG